MSALASRWLKPAVAPFLIAIGATSWCAWSTGPGLALFFGAVLLAALYVPFLTLMEPPAARWNPPLAAGLGVGVCWAVALLFCDVTGVEWMRCLLICFAFSLALAGATSALTRLPIPPSLAAAVVVVVALFWLTWPVWLSHGLNQSRVNGLVVAHPLLAINGVLQYLGAWDRAPLAYQRLTILNQDIPYHLPRSIMPAVLVHGAIATIGFAITVRRSENPPV